MPFEFGEVQTFVSDLKVALDFYQTKLGLTLVQASEQWAIFNISSVEFVIMAGADPRRHAPYGTACMTVLCLKSRSIEADIQKLKATGVKVVKEVESVPQGKFAVITDPDENLIEIIQQ